ncbi:MAG TPA: dTDP-4-dehydrorhamnose 3,5-epimerase, partial [Acidimicrobiaceae bacterium]|nr:dTDP-4-dehydrorhamnose 3,5-epimerase [Acidimicrobiaceae bacterium]
TLADETVVAYKVTALYEPHAERSIRFDDPDLGIDWPVDSADAVLSDKDAAAPSFAEFLQGLP